jgi:methylphosphotriester-DNA--protein-cysteine methyltransferase
MRYNEKPAVFYSILLFFVIVLWFYSVYELQHDTAQFVWGNNGSHIYHWSGCPNYPAQVNPLSNWQRFNSRADAEAAGFRPARNCPVSVPSSEKER